MNTSQKQKIVDLLPEFIERCGSQRKACMHLPISQAYLIQMLKGDFSKVSLDKWNALARAVGFSFTGWQIAETIVHKELSAVLNVSCSENQVSAIVSPTSSGKSSACKHYKQQNPHCAYVECDSQMTFKELYKELLASLGVSIKGTVYKQKKELAERMKGKQTSLVIIDEPQKLKKAVFVDLIGLVNKLDNNSGLVLIGTQVLEDRITDFMRSGDSTADEFYSRIGKKIIHIKPLTLKDFKEVCQANGITDPVAIEGLIEESKWDFRRLRKLIEVKRVTRSKTA